MVRFGTDSDPSLYGSRQIVPIAPIFVFDLILSTSKVDLYIYYGHPNLFF